MHRFSHLNAVGDANMVDMTSKKSSKRVAVAEVKVIVGTTIGRAINSGELTKGNVFATARLAGIQAAKRTWELIPLCHQLPLDSVQIDIELNQEQDQVHIQARAHCYGKTGVEMEALTAASVSALTVYDMCKSIDKGIIISDLHLLHKSGGKSGEWNKPKAGKN